MKVTATILLILSCLITQGQGVKKEILITQKYINLPVQESQERQQMTFIVDGKKIRDFVIRLSDDEPDYWVFADVSEWKGKKLTIQYPAKTNGFKQINQADQFAGQDSLYKEIHRPQFHFSSRRGWNNDPNGLVFHKGTYHLYYQHNPYEANWENMHWGHAISTDLLHWEELSDALYPDELGTMFSGTATIDFDNTAGFQTGDEPSIIAAYTAHKYLGEGDAIQTQCIAYSNDEGKTFTKYAGNPIINSKQKWDSRNTRDPKIFWHKPSNKWVMVLFERDGHSFYNSDDLKNWTYLSHLGGFWECPELFELPVDGNKFNTKWVIYGASGTYMIGEFDGKKFHVESGKHTYTSGSLYAAQTYNNIPESDGRRIQLAWGRIEHRGMPFKHMMLFPTELTLRSTRNGIRMFSEPIAEIAQLHQSSQQWSNLDASQANTHLQSIKGDLLHLKMKVKIHDGINFQLLYNGNPIAIYDMNYNKLNGVFYESERAENSEIELELLIDKTSVELFADKGHFSISTPLPPAKDNNGLKLVFGRASINVPHLEVHELKSIW